MKDFKAEAEDLFDTKTMKELCGCLNLSDADKIAAFRSDLIGVCAHYRLIISTLPCDLPSAPFNLSLTKRANWLETNVVKPGRKLLDALTDENRPHFSTWPYPLDPPKFRDNAKLIQELTDVIAEADELRQDLRNQQAGDAGHSQELRQEIFNSLALLFREYAPEVPPNRGVYDPENRQRYGSYVDAMRLAFTTITGAPENLDRLIRGEINFPS